MKQLGRNAPQSCTMQKVEARMLIEYNAWNKDG